MEYFLGTLFIIICILLIIVVLLQKGRGGGLGAAFGGASSSAFGTRTGDVFTWVTIVLTALFLLLAVGTTMQFRPETVTVATPTISPDPESVEPGTKVRVALYETNPNAKIHYTLDGSAPKPNAAGTTLYEKQFTVESGTTVKAIAVAPGMENSKIATATYGKAKKKATTTTRGALTTTTQGAGTQPAQTNPVNGTTQTKPATDAAATTQSE